MKQALLEKYNIETDRLFFEVNVMGRVFSTSIWYKGAIRKVHPYEEPAIDVYPMLLED